MNQHNSKQQTIDSLQNLYFLLLNIQELKQNPSSDDKQITRTSTSQLHQNVKHIYKLTLTSKISQTIVYYQIKEMLYCEKVHIQHQINHRFLVQTYEDLTFAQIIIKELLCDLKDQEMREQGESQFRKAMDLYSMNNKINVQKSISIYESILVVLPKNLAVLNNLALAYRKHDNLKQSKQIFEKSLRIHPQSHQLHLNYATTLLLIDNSPSNLNFIIQTLQKSLTLEPRQYQSYYTLGCAYKYKKQYQKSIDYFTNSIKNNPNNHNSYYALASIYKQIHQNQLALNIILRCLVIKKGHHLALICLGNILIQLFISRKHPQVPQELTVVLSQYTNQKDYFSVNQYKRLKSISQIYDRCSKQGYRSIQLFNGLGTICLLQKKYHKAITYFTKIIDEYNKHMFGYYGVALSYYYLKQFKKSLQKYQQALQRSQDQSVCIIIGYILCILKSQAKSNVLTRLFSILQKLRKSNELVCYFKAMTLEGLHKQEMIAKGLSLSSNSKESSKIVFDIMFQLEDYTTALKHYTKYLSNNSFHDEDYFIGRCHEELGQKISAVNRYTNQLRCNPSDQHTLYRVASMYYSLPFSRQNYHIIYSLIKSILQINPYSIKTILLYSNLQMDQCLYSKRLPLLRNLLMLNEYSADACNSLALGYLYNDQQYQCLNYLNLGNKKDPNNSLIYQNLACLELLINKKQIAFKYFKKSLDCSDTNLAVYINCQEEIHVDKLSEKAINLFYYSLGKIAKGQNEKGLRLYMKFLCKKEQIPKYELSNYISTLKFMRQRYNSSSNFSQLFKFLLIRTFYNKLEIINAFNIFIRINQTNDYISQLAKFHIDFIEKLTDQELKNELYFIILQQMFQIDEHTAMRTNQFFCQLSPQFCNKIDRIKLINTYNFRAINKIRSLINKLSVFIKQHKQQTINVLQTGTTQYTSSIISQIPSQFSIFQQAQIFKQKFITLQNNITLNDLYTIFNITNQRQLREIIYNATHIKFREYQQLQEQIMNLKKFIWQIQSNYLKQLKKSIQNYILIDLKDKFLQYYQDNFVPLFCIKFMYNCLYFYVQEIDRKQLIQYFWQLFSPPKLSDKIAVIKNIQSYIRQKSIINLSNSLGSNMFLSSNSVGSRILLSSNSIGSKIIVQSNRFGSKLLLQSNSFLKSFKSSNSLTSKQSFSQKDRQNKSFINNESTEQISFQRDIDNSINKHQITPVIMQNSQLSQFFSSWSRQSQMYYSQKLIQKSCINPANDEDSYLYIKQIVQKEVEYYQICAHFRSANDQIYSYFENNDKRPKYLIPIPKQNNNSQKKHKQYLNFEKIMQKQKRVIFGFIYSLFEMVKELQQYQIYHFDLSYRNIILQQNEFKLMDFEHSIIYSPQNKSIFTMIECCLKYPPQMQQNIIEYIFKQNSKKVLQQWNNLQQYFSKYTQQSQQRNIKIQLIVNAFRDFCGQYSLIMHLQQINMMISNIIESDNINQEHIFTLQHKQQIRKLLKRDFLQPQNSNILDKIKQFMNVQ